MRKRLAGITGVGSISIALAVLLFAPFLLLAQPPPSPPLRVQDSSGTPTGRPRTLQFTGCTVTYSGSTVTISGCAGTPSTGADPFTVTNTQITGSTVKSINGAALNVSVTPPAQTAASQAGLGLTISASNAVDGSSTHGAAAGADLTLTTGTGVNGGATGKIQLFGGTNGYLQLNGNGDYTLANNAGTAFARLRFGGATTGFSLAATGADILRIQSQNGSGEFGEFSSAGLRLGSTGQVLISSGTLNGSSADTGLARSAAGVVKVTDGASGFGGLVLRLNASAAAPTLQFTTNGGVGWDNGCLTFHDGSATAPFAISSADHGMRAFGNATYGWISAGSGSASAAANDTGLSRLSAAVVGVGNGTNGDISGTLRLAQVQNQTANGGQWVQGQSSELLTLSTSGTTTDTSANLLPANSVIRSCVARVTTTITTATSWAVGDPTTAARFAAANSTMTAGATSVGIAQVDQTGAAGPKQTAAAKVRITTVGTPGAGAVRITCFYDTFVAPTS